jgi:inorganic pyrophosphatase/exopolyphosphatase
MLGEMGQASARLLMCGILDNTLNFGAKITTERDRRAYQELSKIADLPEDWPAQYFAACQAGIVHDLPQVCGTIQRLSTDIKRFLTRLL